MRNAPSPLSTWDWPSGEFSSAPSGATVPRALMGLIQIGVVALDDDGNIYICEEELADNLALSSPSMPIERGRGI